ncbi:hypothetical protein BJ165DRAFT_1610778 [Panaeolus papilionaceus]|nr:hypothetical protein BJ165DRAFT_1610778 [Panaeolus papilionaceus]
MDPITASAAGMTVSVASKLALPALLEGLRGMTGRALFRSGKDYLDKALKLMYEADEKDLLTPSDAVGMLTLCRDLVDERITLYDSTMTLKGSLQNRSRASHFKARSKLLYNKVLSATDVARLTRQWEEQLKALGKGSPAPERLAKFKEELRCAIQSLVALDTMLKERKENSPENTEVESDDERKAREAKTEAVLTKTKADMISAIDSALSLLGYKFAADVGPAGLPSESTTGVDGEPQPSPPFPAETLDLPARLADVPRLMKSLPDLPGSQSTETVATPGASASNSGNPLEQGMRSAPHHVECLRSIKPIPVSSSDQRTTHSPCPPRRTTSCGREEVPTDNIPPSADKIFTEGTRSQVAPSKTSVPQTTRDVSEHRDTRSFSLTSPSHRHAATATSQGDDQPGRLKMPHNCPPQTVTAPAERQNTGELPRSRPRGICEQQLPTKKSPTSARHDTSEPATRQESRQRQLTTAPQLPSRRRSRSVLVIHRHACCSFEPQEIHSKTRHGSLSRGRARVDRSPPRQGIDSKRSHNDHHDRGRSQQRKH